MHKEKPKNENTSRRAFRNGMMMGTGVVVLVLLVVGAVNSLLGPTIGSMWKTETVIVPFNRTEPTWTKELYSSSVRLTIHGTGQAAGNDYSDAFYQFTQGGQTLETPLTYQFDLEIDGQRAIITLGLEDNPPPYNREHIYSVSYDVGSEPRRIAFRISDLITGDNSGEFTIVVNSPDLVKGLSGG